MENGYELRTARQPAVSNGNEHQTSAHRVDHTTARVASGEWGAGSSTPEAQFIDLLPYTPAFTKPTPATHRST